MSSQSQIEANRANAVLSTGPRTDQGKAASAQNARTHGLTSKDLVILPHEQDDFLNFQIELTEQIKPNGQLEHSNSLPSTTSYTPLGTCVASVASKPSLPIPAQRKGRRPLPQTSQNNPSYRRGRQFRFALPW